jgi:DNA-binding LytR/AlgR family response regulator
MMHTGIIVEDLKPAADILMRFCQRSGAVGISSHFLNAEEALTYLDKHRVDVMFLDVEMPGISGFELMDRLEYPPQVILTTSKTEYAYDAFQYNVTDYLRKPFSYDRFLESVQKLRQSKSDAVDAPADHIFIKVDGKLLRLESQDIHYIESMGDYVRFVTRNRKYITHNTIKNIESRVEGMGFLKVHRSYIVNMSQVDDLQDTNLIVKGVSIPVSKSHKMRIRQELNII